MQTLAGWSYILIKTTTTLYREMVSQLKKLHLLFPLAAKDNPVGWTQK